MRQVDSYADAQRDVLCPVQDGVHAEGEEKVYMADEKCYRWVHVERDVVSDSALAIRSWGGHTWCRRLRYLNEISKMVT